MSAEAESVGTLTAELSMDKVLTFLRACSAVAAEAVVETTETGFEVRTIDPATVLMGEVSLSLPQGTTPGVEFGINAYRLLPALEPFPWQDTEMEIDTELREIRFSNRSEELTYSYLAPDTIRHRPTMPELDLPLTVSVAPDEFAEVLETVERVGSAATFTWNEERDRFGIRAEDEEFSYRVNSRTDRPEPPEGEVNSMFSSDYLQELVPVIEDADSVELHVGAFEMLLCRVVNSNGVTARYCLAPRIAGGDRE